MTQREIKFRGKRLDNGKWVFGSLAMGFRGEPGYIMQQAYYATRDMGEVDKDGLPKIEDEMAIGGFIPVDPRTVGQFTGRTDKHGKEIYEGDIVKDDIGFIWEIYFDNYRAWFWWKNDNTSEGVLGARNCPDDPEYPRWFDCEVIGNIYENPELLDNKSPCQ